MEVWFTQEPTKTLDSYGEVEVRSMAGEHDKPSKWQFTVNAYQRKVIGIWIGRHLDVILTSLLYEYILPGFQEATNCTQSDDETELQEALKSQVEVEVKDQDEDEPGEEFDAGIVESESIKLDEDINLGVQYSSTGHTKGSLQMDMVLYSKPLHCRKLSKMMWLQSNAMIQTRIFPNITLLKRILSLQNNKEQLTKPHNSRQQRTILLTRWTLMDKYLANAESVDLDDLSRVMLY
ncbi:hypothetical protein F5880DRAFT_1728594 [Lentinula raphanica]|nr:hypothetical protein F5880DRAFT_1728594 [Lentinula raphanica]